VDEEFIRDFFASEGPISVRRMFGGQGIYIDGAIVAVVLRDELLLKADDETAAFFEEAGSLRWRYRREGKAAVAMPYYSVPPEALDDPEAMAVWARRAREAGVRAAMSSKPKRRGKPPTGRSRST
jgi:DNA transformation protein and related proteins